jgi:Utp13 specific WD40 associated domain
MAVSVDGAQVVTGGTDSVLSVWADRTKEVAAEEAADHAGRVVKQQELSNLLLAKRYTPALVLALQLELPRRALKVLNTMGVEAGSPQRFQTQLLTVVGELSEEQLGKVLLYARDWNTNAHHCVVAHQLLAAVLRCYPPHKIAEFELLPRQQCKEFLAAMLSYTERHQERVRALSQATYLLDHTLDEMRLLSMTEEPAASVVGELSKRKQPHASTRLSADADAEWEHVDEEEEDEEEEDEEEEEALTPMENVQEEEEEEEEEEHAVVVVTQTRRRSSRATSCRRVASGSPRSARTTNKRARK